MRLRIFQHIINPLHIFIEFNKMKIINLDSTSSTQNYLINLVKKDNLSENIAVVSKVQTDGIGSRDNNWIGEKGNLFFSIAMKKDLLPIDIPLQSFSIYFSYILKEILALENPQLFLKWSNDFYIENLKVGGIVTNIVRDFIIIGIGINTVKSSEFGVLKTTLSNLEIVEKYILEIKKAQNWKYIFQRYSKEFDKSRIFSTHIQGKKVSLKNAKLNFDGSITIQGKQIFSLR